MLSIIIAYNSGIGYIFYLTSITTSTVKSRKVKLNELANSFLLSLEIKFKLLFSSSLRYQTILQKRVVRKSRKDIQSIYLL